MTYTVEGREIYDDVAGQYVISCGSKHEAQRVMALLNLASGVNTDDIATLGWGWLERQIATDAVLLAELRTALEGLVAATRCAYTRPGDDTMALANAEQAATAVLAKCGVRV